MDKVLWEQEKDLLYFFRMKIWMILLNYKILRRFGCINWWSHWNTGGFVGALLAPLATFLVQPVISSVVKAINGRRVRRAGKGHINKNF